MRLAATTFEWAEDIDAARAQRAKERAEELLQHAHDRHEQSVAQARLNRALTRLGAAGK